MHHPCLRRPREAKIVAGLSGDNCIAQGWSFCRFGHSVEGKSAVVLGSGNGTEVEMAAVVAVGNVTAGVGIELVYFGNFRTDSSSQPASVIAPGTAPAALA